MSVLSLNLLGPPRLEIDGEKIDITRRKSLALLAYLAVTGQPQSRDMLATLLWPEADQSRSRAALRNAIWALNQTAVSTWLATRGELVEIRPPSDSGGSESALEVDVKRFRSLIDRAVKTGHESSSYHPDSVKLLTEAVALHRSEFMAGFTLPDAPAFDEWQFFERSSIQQTLSRALANLVERLSLDGQYEMAIPYGRQLVALDPLHEPAQRSLMRLFAQAGQQQAALRQYDVARSVLRQELGVDPSPETIALNQEIAEGRLTAVATDRRMPEPARRKAASTSDNKTSSVPNNLPVDVSPFVGRALELSRLTSFLEDESTKLTTLVGPGGIGKTRLALAAAAVQRTTNRFADGIYFVPLAPLADPAIVLSSVAEAIKYPLQIDQRTGLQQLVDYLGSRSMLLVLDNFEHLLIGESNPAIELVDAIIRRAPGVTILITSRERLNLYGEQQLLIGGLEVAANDVDNPDGTYAAAELFLQSARRLRPEYELETSDLFALGKICRLVEGMPLALELAATWLDTLSMAEIAAEIGKSLDFLATDLRNIPERHRSMQAVFQTTWQTLDATDQSTFAQLSVFRGGFTGDAARAIADATPAVLRRLVKRSLLRFSPDEQRYDIHELLRQFALEKLAAQTQAARSRHAFYYAEFLRRQERALKGKEQREALRAIGRDSQNVREAFLWSSDNLQPALVMKSLPALNLFMEWRRQTEDGASLMAHAAESLTSPLQGGSANGVTPVDTEERKALAESATATITHHAAFRLMLSQAETAREQLNLAQHICDEFDLADYGDPTVIAFFALTKSNLAILDDFAGEAERLNEEALELYQSAGDRWGMALALERLSMRFMNQGQLEQAINVVSESLAIREQLEDRRGVARGHNVLGLVLLHAGEIERSQLHLRQSIELFRELDNEADLSNPLAVLGLNLLFAGKFTECIAAYDECWTIHRRLSLPREPFLADVTVTRARLELGQYDAVLTQGESSLALYRSRNDSWSIAFVLNCLGRVDLVNGDAERAVTRLEESANILYGMNERSLLPEVLFCLAIAHRDHGYRDQAVACLADGVRMILETGPLSPMRFELPAMALLLVDDGEVERAVELYAAAQQSNYIANSRWFKDVVGQRVEQAKPALPSRSATVAEEQGAKRDLWQTAKELLDELTTNAAR